MGNNLTGQQINLTYQQLVQISGSSPTDGTGSVITNLNVSASYASTSGFAGTAGFATSASHAINASTATSASYALQAGTAGYAAQAGTSGFATSASFAQQAGTAGFATQAGTSGFATSASFAQTASFALNAVTNSGSFMITGSVSSNTLYLFENGNIYHKSRAAMKLIPYLKRPFCLLKILYIFPRFFRDFVYDRIAANRKVFFKDVCELISFDKNRFL
jgi:hypothetical protein